VSITAHKNTLPSARPISLLARSLFLPNRGRTILPTLTSLRRFEWCLELFQTLIGCVGVQSELCQRSEDPPRFSREGKLELIEVLRSSAGGAANWATFSPSHPAAPDAVFHQARAAEETHWGMRCERGGLFAVTGPAGLVRQSLCRFAGLQILIDPCRHLAPFGNGPDDERYPDYDFATGGPAPTSAAPSRSNAASAF
jgi:hypothetical protein